MIPLFSVTYFNKIEHNVAMTFDCLPQIHVTIRLYRYLLELENRLMQFVLSSLNVMARINSSWRENEITQVFRGC